jgi:hypothetical protein
MESLYKTKYSELLKEHEKLKHDYSENVIIQSMNSMKEIYNERVYEYDLLNEKYNEMCDQLDKLKKSEEYLLKRKRLLEENIRAVIIMLYTLKENKTNYIDLKSKIQFIEDILYNVLNF